MLPYKVTDKNIGQNTFGATKYIISYLSATCQKILDSSLSKTFSSSTSFFCSYSLLFCSTTDKYWRPKKLILSISPSLLSCIHYFFLNKFVEWSSTVWLWFSQNEISFGIYSSFYLDLSSLYPGYFTPVLLTFVFFCRFCFQLNKTAAETILMGFFIWLHAILFLLILFSRKNYLNVSNPNHLLIAMPYQ